jgi:hypothetical protein
MTEPSHAGRVSRGNVPAIVEAAGDAAVASYQTFFYESGFSKNTCKIYVGNARGFFRWAENRELRLESIKGNDVAAYASEVRARSSAQTAYVSLTPVRGLFRQFVRQGVLAHDPCQTAAIESRNLEAIPATRKQRRPPKARPIAEASPAAEFPLLALMAILGNMEDKSRRRVFDGDGDALSLWEFVRWRDGVVCPQCGTPRQESCVGPEWCCEECNTTHSALEGSLFESSIVPIRHAFFLVHAIYLSDAPAPDLTALVSDWGIELSAITTLCSRIRECLDEQGLTQPDDLRHAVAKQDKELAQDEVVRSIMEYAELQGHRNELLRAQAEGIPLPGLPEGMSLDEALSTIEARIADHDRYVIHLEDGYLVQRLSLDASSPTDTKTDASERAHSDDLSAEPRP